MKIHELLFEMPNLLTTDTGLPVNIWVSSGQSVNFRHGPRLKIFKTIGKFNYQELASIRIKKNVTTDDIIGYSQIPPNILDNIKDFIDKNYETLIDFWFGRIDRKTLDARIIKI